MSGEVAADPTVLNHLRQSLLSITDSQIATLDRMLQELTRTQLELEQARQRWKREVARRQSDLRACEYEAMMAAAMGGGVDCSPCRRALAEAKRQFQAVENECVVVRQAGERYRQADQRNRGFLSGAVPAMRAGLEARAVSLEAYLAQTVGSAGLGSAPNPVNASRVIVDDLAVKQLYEATKLPPGGENREGDVGGTERMG
jgi:hypothetical protein